jgi:EAL domain-containing protein (putative c-di-GMP-specific phosphodiesterase class I)
MDAPDFKRAVPFFQPIIKSADLGVFAYEVLAREERNGRIHSLGPYFEDPTVSDLDKLTLDIHLRKIAFETYAASGCQAKLFVNLKPSWIEMHKERYKGLSTLAMLEKHKIDPQNIVIEVTEEELTGDHDVFGKLLTEYRNAGCMLAIDDFGKGSSSVERIAQVMPDIIKVDHAIVREMDTQRSFYDICRAMGAFGAVSGFDLLFEGVETSFQLERCLKTGWCYLQGYLFAKARPGFETEYANKDLLADILTIQNAKEEWNIRHRSELYVNMVREVDRLAPLAPLDEKALLQPVALRALAQGLPHYCVRCFVCDDKGRLLSRVYRLEGHDAVTLSDGPSSVGFSYETFVRGLSDVYKDKGYLTDIYKNVATKEDVMTYMHMQRRDRLLCVDIMASVLS